MIRGPKPLNDTSWDIYGTGNHEKYADRMVHVGHGPRAAADTVRRPGAPGSHTGDAGTERPMAPEIPLDKQRPSRLLFDDFVSGRGRRNHRAVNEPTGVNG